MRILEVLDTYYPKFDGPNLVITSYCKSLNKIDGCSAEVCVPYFPQYKDNQLFNVFRVKSLKGPEGYHYAIPSFDKKLKRFLKDNKFDIIHVHSPFTMCNFFTKYGKRNNIPVIFTFHTKYHEDFDRTIKLKFIRKLAMKYIMNNINKAYKVLSVSNGAGNCLKDYGYKKDIDIIRNGTDLFFPKNSEDLKKKINELYGLTSNDLMFLSVGRIVENKKLDFAIQVMQYLKEKNIKFKYIIVGSGPYESTLKAKVNELKLDDCIIFAGKIMDRELLSAYYLRSNLFIFPSTFDTASLAPIEAAALKLPTIMTEGCSTAEIITKNQNGILAKENDVKDWGEQIIEAIQKMSLFDLGEKAFNQVYKTWDDVAKDVFDYYKKVIKEFKKIDKK